MHMFESIISVSDLYLEYFVIGAIAKDIYDNTLLLECSACSYEHLFPQNNIHYMLGYSFLIQNSYASFVCNNINDFVFRAYLFQVGQTGLHAQPFV